MKYIFDIKINIHLLPSDNLITLGKLDSIIQTINQLTSKTDKIMGAQEDDAAKLEAVATQLDKISTESSASLALIADLQAQIAALPQVSPALQAAIDKVAAKAQIIDDLVADVPLPPPATV